VMVICEAGAVRTCSELSEQQFKNNKFQERTFGASAATRSMPEEPDAAKTITAKGVQAYSNEERERKKAPTLQQHCEEERRRQHQDQLAGHGPSQTTAAVWRSCCCD
jgi:hypothetical protein